VYGSNSGMYGSGWNAATYGGGFVKYGPGDGGALQRSGDWIVEIKQRIAESESKPGAIDYQATSGLVNQAWSMIPDNQGGIFFIYQGMIAHWASFSIYVPQKSGSVVFSDADDAKSFMIEYMKVTDVIVVAHKLQNGTTIVLPTSGNEYNNLRRSKNVLTNAHAFSFYTELVPHKYKGDNYYIKTNTSYEKNESLILGLPDIRSYYFYRGYYDRDGIKRYDDPARTSWFLPFIGWEEKAIKTGASSLEWFYLDSREDLVVKTKMLKN